MEYILILNPNLVHYVSQTAANRARVKRFHKCSKVLVYRLYIKIAVKKKLKVPSIISQILSMFQSFSDEKDFNLILCIISRSWSKKYATPCIYACVVY